MATKQVKWQDILATRYLLLATYEQITLKLLVSNWMRFSLSGFKAAESDKVPVILVVEDDEDNQLLLEHTITMFGWKYLDANNAIAALNFAKS